MENRRRSKIPPQLILPAINTSNVPEKLTFAEQQKLRDEFARARKNALKKKAEQEYKGTYVAWQTLKFDQLKTKTSKKLMHDAYVTYSPASKAANRALQSIEKEKDTADTAHGADSHA